MNIKKEFFISKNNKRESENLLNKALKEGLDFKLNNKVVKYIDQEEIKKSILEPIPKKPLALKKLIKECKNKIMRGSVNFSNPHFVAFPDSGNSLAALSGHIIYGMVNQNLINSIHCAPTATFVEIAVINWLRETIGYKIIKKQMDSSDIGGINVPGGTLANTIAVLLARERKSPETMKKGLNNIKKPLIMFIPEGIGHYTSKAAMGWLGLGTENIVTIKTTSNFTIDQKDLLDKIKRYRKVGRPFILIAYAGDSRTMAIDNFKELSKITKKYNIWFHIDACHGASLCFSNKLKHKVKDIKLADSVTIDPHKVLFVPYSASYLLLKDPKSIKPVMGISDLITKEPYSFGQVTPFLGSRAFNSLKVWFTIKHLGKEKIGKLIEERHKKALFFGNLINKSKNFYLMNNIEINSVVYLYVPPELKKDLNNKNSEKTMNKINELNLRIQKRMFKEGSFYVHTFKLNDFKNILGAGKDKIYQMQRLMLGNPLTTKKDLYQLLEHTKKISNDEWIKMDVKNV